MKFEIKAQNIKCEGCSSAIENGLGDIADVSSVTVDVPSGLVSVESGGDIVGDVKKRLAELGYPAQD